MAVPASNTGYKTQAEPTLNIGLLVKPPREYANQLVVPAMKDNYILVQTQACVKSLSLCTIFLSELNEPNKGTHGNYILVRHFCSASVILSVALWCLYLSNILT